MSNTKHQNLSQEENDIYDHINRLETNKNFSTVIDYFSIPPHLQKHNVYFLIYHELKVQKPESYISFIDSILSEIHGLLKKFEHASVLAEFHSISKEEHDNFVMNNVFKSLNISQNTCDIKKYPLTESKLLKLKSQLSETRFSILEKKINNKINLRESAQNRVFQRLKDFFIKEEHDALKVVLAGKSLHEKITFRGNQNQLAELFRRLKYNNQLDAKYSEIKDWLYYNFKYSKENKDLNQNSLKEILTAKNNKDISPSKRLLTDYFPYKKPNQVKNDKSI